MSRKPSVRTYGKRARKPQLGGGYMALGELDPNMSISTTATRSTDADDSVKEITSKVNKISIQDEERLPPRRRARPPPQDPAPKKPPTRQSARPPPPVAAPEKTPTRQRTCPPPPVVAPQKPSIRQRAIPPSPDTAPKDLPTRQRVTPTSPATAPTKLPIRQEAKPASPATQSASVEQRPETPIPPKRKTRLSIATPLQELEEQDCLRTLNWENVCPVGDRIEKIAEASYAEVYRISNERGTSIIKVIRLESSIKPQTKAQQKSGLVDEEPHSEQDLEGELRISELVADIPGFVVYKEKYLVEGKTTPALLETHQVFHRKMKRKDPGRLQYYPSPSRYLKDTRFLVVELGDAGMALEDLSIQSTDQVWDVFLGVVVALARAENLMRFEHRDLHEGNICFRQTRPRRSKVDKSPCRYGYSGIDVTILDYGLSRAEDVNTIDSAPIAHDLERDLSLFTSTHAKQCQVYRQMRSFLISGDRIWLPPTAHNKPYEDDACGSPISWQQHHPYTNALWLAYLYDYLIANYRGDKKDLRAFRKDTRELWAHLDPDASLEIMSFSSAEDVVEFAVEAGWITEEQLISCGTGEGFSMVAEESIIESRLDRADNAHLRRSPRKQARHVVG